MDPPGHARRRYRNADHAVMDPPGVARRYRNAEG